MISVQGVVRTYGKKHTAFTALDDVSFAVPSGASAAIIGKSGSGKSTLMHVMSGLDRPQQGAVVVDGVDVTTLPPKKMDTFRAKTIGFIFQSFFVQGNESVYDNVSLALEAAEVPRVERKQRIHAALESVDLLDKVRSKAKDLSGGQKQRLAIARAIVNKPSIIFADEPTGNLDTATSEVIEALLFNHSKQHGATLVIVTHDPELAAKCDMQLTIKDGKVTSIVSARGEVK